MMNNENEATTNAETESLTFNFISLEEIKASPIRLKRMAQIFKLRTIDNMSWPDISKTVGVTIPTCYADYNEVCKKFWEKNVDDLQKALITELSKLDTLEAAYLDSALSGNHQSAQILINVSKQRNKLLQLDKFAQNKLVASQDDTHEYTITYADENAWRNNSLPSGDSLKGVPTDKF